MYTKIYCFREVVVQVNEKGLGLTGTGNKEICILHDLKFSDERRTLRVKESHSNVACLDLSKQSFEVHKRCSWPFIRPFEKI